MDEKAYDRHGRKGKTFSEIFLNRRPNFSALFNGNKGYADYYSQFVGPPEQREAAAETPYPQISKDVPESKRGLDIDRKSQQDLILRVRESHSQLLKSTPPRLSEKAESQLSSNYSQLALAESNLISTIEGLRSVYITSCFPKEGKTTTAISLSYALAVYSNKMTLLVDTNLSSPQIHRFFGISSPIGLVDVLEGSKTLVEAIVPTYYDNLFLLPNIETETASWSSFRSSSIEAFLETVAANFDYIVLDGSPGLSAPGLVFWAGLLDGVAVTVECERTKWEVVQILIEKIKKAKGKVAGIVLNKRHFYIPEKIYRIL